MNVNSEPQPIVKTLSSFADLANRPQVTELVVSPEALADADSIKILTGRGISDLLDVSGKDFNDLFGLNRVTKSVVSLAQTEKKEFDQKTLSQIAVDITEVRRTVRQKNPSFDKDRVDYEALKLAVDKYLPGVDLPNQEYVKRHKDDALLNIGDPFQKLAKEIDEPRHTDLDYEFAQDVDNLTRTVGHVTEAIDENRKGFRGPGWYQNAHDMREWMRRQEDPPHPYDAFWFGGYTDPKTGEKKIAGFDSVVTNALAKLDALNESSSTVLLEETKKAWGEVQDYLAIRKAHYLETEKRDITKPDYDTEFGLSPIDGLAKDAYYMAQAATNGLGVLSYYRDTVYPELIYKYLEDLADANIKLSAGPRSQDIGVFSQYQRAWSDFLKSRGFDPDTYNPFSEDSKFVDNLIDFFLINGTNFIKEVDANLFNKIRMEESQALELGFPTVSHAKEANVVRGMFPYTQSLPTQSYDRILASWSFSAHMFPNLTSDQIVDAFWPELDRLLAKNGKAVIFPIGHYGESVEEVLATIDAYNQKASAHLSYETSKSRDDRFPNDTVLIIHKK